MMILPLLWILALMGFFLFFLSEIEVQFYFMHFNWLGIIFVMMALIGMTWRLFTSQSARQFDSLDKQSALLEYLRRDASAIDVIGTRVYSGESFLDVPKLGLIEDFGKDCVYSKGGKKKRFGLENINFTPDPRYWNLTAEYYKLGFNNPMDVWDVFNGKNLELMGKVYLNMCDGENVRGVSKLIKEIKENKPRKNFQFKSSKDKVPIEKLVDKVIKRD